VPGSPPPPRVGTFAPDPDAAPCRKAGGRGGGNIMSGYSEHAFDQAYELVLSYVKSIESEVLKLIESDANAKLSADFLEERLRSYYDALGEKGDIGRKASSPYQKLVFAIARYAVSAAFDNETRFSSAVQLGVEIEKQRSRLTAHNRPNKPIFRQARDLLGDEAVLSMTATQIWKAMRADKATGAEFERLKIAHTRFRQKHRG
jgi:hypothetical protein